MKRVFSLFLAMLIVLQSMIAVGEEQVPALMVSTENTLSAMPSTRGTGEGESFTGESGEQGQDFSLSNVSENTSGEGEQFSSGIFSGIDAEKEKSAETGKTPEGAASENGNPASTSYLEANKKKEFQYKDENITVNAVLSVPESLPKGVVFLVRPITEEERPEQYSAFKDALTDYKEEEEKEKTFAPKELRLYDVGFFRVEEKTGEYEEVEPKQGSVDIRFSFRKPLEGEGKLQAAHLPLKEEKKEDGMSTLDVPDVQKEDVHVEELSVKEGKKVLGEKREKLEFSLKSFSPVAIWKGNTTEGERIKKDVDFSLSGFKGIFFEKTATHEVEEDFTQGAVSGNTTNWTIAKNYSPMELDKIRLSFSMKIHDGMRETKAGDKIHFVFPELFSDIKDSGTNTGETEVDGHKLYKYRIFKNTDGKWELEITFLEAIEDEGLSPSSARILMLLTIDQSKWKEGGEEQAEFVLPKAIHRLGFPPVPEKISGIEKTATEDLQNGKIKWEIKVGTESKGVNLNGLTLIDSFDESSLKYASAVWKNPETGLEEPIEFTEVGRDGGKIQYAYTFPNHPGKVIRAPQTVIVTTNVKKAVFKDPNPSVEKSEIVLSHSNLARLDTDPNKRKAEAELTIPKVELKKNGQQLSGNRVRWTIDFNKNHAWVYDATVVDELSEGLEIDETKGITVQNLDSASKEAITLDSAHAMKNFTDLTAGSAQRLKYAVEHRASGSNLRLDFGLSFKQAYRISFETTVKPNFTMSNLDDGSGKQGVKNVAKVIARYPTGDGELGEPPELPSVVNVPFEDAFIRKSAGNAPDKKNALLSWNIECSTRGEGYDEAAILDTIGGDSALYDLSLSYNGKTGLSSLWENKEAGFFGAKRTRILQGEDGGDMAEISMQYSRESAPYKAGGELKLHVKRLASSSEIFNIAKMHFSYRTKALHYIGHNRENHAYANHATLKISEEGVELHSMDSGEVVQTMENRLLSKEIKSFYDDANKKSYFHFKILANEDSYQGLKDVHIEDSLANVFFYKDSSGVHSLDAKYFHITSSSDLQYPTKAVLRDNGVESAVSSSNLTIDNTAHSVDVRLTDPLNEVLELNIYAYLTPDGERLLFHNTMAGTPNLQDTEIFARNTVEMKSSSFPESQRMNPTPAVLPPDTTVRVTSEGRGATENLLNDILKKKGEQQKNGYFPTETVSWKVLINPLGANLYNQGILTDKIPEGLFLDRGSIRLYETEHQPGTAELIEDTSNPAVVPVPDSGVGSYKAEVLRDFNAVGAVETTLKVTLPENSSKSYLLCYNTIINTEKEDFKSVENTISVDSRSQSKTIVKLDDFSFSRGSVRVRFKIKKVDALSREVALSGAIFGLFKESDYGQLASASYTQLLGLAEDFQVTDAKGELRFIGKRGEKYYIKEIKAPVGYQLDETIYGPYEIKTGEPGTKKLAPFVSGVQEGDDFPNYREQKKLKTGRVEIKNVFEADNATLPSPLYRGKNAGNRDGYTSSFKLFIFPDKTKDKVVQVKLDADPARPGVYFYKGKAVKEEDKKLMVTSPSSLAVAGLQVENLPWGKYRLVEENTEDGYLMPNMYWSGKTHGAVVEFEVQQEVDASGVGTETTDLLYDGEKDVQNKIVVRNAPTIFSFEKTDEKNPAGKLTDGLFRLIGKKEDFLSGTTPSPYTLKDLPDGKACIEITGADLAGGFSLSGVLKTDTVYSLQELNAPAGYQIGAVNGGSFKLQKDGKGIVIQTNEDRLFSVKNQNTLSLKNLPTSFSFKEIDSNFGENEASGKVLYTGFALYPAKENGDRDSETAVETWENNSDNKKTVSKLKANHYYRLEREKQSILYEQSKNDSGNDNDFFLFKLSHDGKRMEEVSGISGKKGLIGAVGSNGKELTVKAKRILAEASLKKEDREPVTPGGTDFTALKGAVFTLYMVKGSDTVANATALDNRGNHLGTAGTGYDYTGLISREESLDIKLGDYKTDENGVLSTKNPVETGNNAPKLPFYGNRLVKDGLPLGVYYFVEKQTVPGYSIEVEKQTVSGYSIEKNKKYVFVVTKQDLEQGGVKKVLKPQSFFSLVQEETGVSPGALPDQAGIAKNSRIPGSLKILKVDSHDHTKKLAGARYGIYTDKDGTVPLMRDGVPLEGSTAGGAHTGELIFDKLSWYQDYYVKELVEPHGYLLDLNEEGNANVYGPFRFSAEKTEINETRDDAVNGVMITRYGIDPLLSYSAEDKKKAHWENEERLSGLQFSITGVFNDGTNAESTRNYTTDTHGSVFISGEFLAGQVYTLKEGTNLSLSYRTTPDLQFKINNKNQISLVDPENAVIAHLDKNYLDLAVERTQFSLLAEVEHHERVGKTETLPLYGLSYLLTEDAGGTQPIPSGLELSVNGKRITTVTPASPSTFVTMKVDSDVKAGVVRSEKRNGYRAYKEGSLSIFGLERGKTYYLRASGSNLAEDSAARKNLVLSPSELGLYKIVVATDSNISVTKVRAGQAEAYSGGNAPVLTYGLKKGSLFLHTTDFETRKKNVGEQKYALYVKKDWSLKTLLEGKGRAEDSIEKGTEYRERAVKETIEYQGEPYILQEIFENDSAGNLRIPNLTLAQDYLLLNVTEEREYDNPKMEMAFRLQENKEGKQELSVLSYGRDARNPARPRYQTAFLLGENLYIRRPNETAPSLLYHLMNKEGILGDAEALQEEPVLNWLLYQRESEGGGGPHISKKGRIPGGNGTTPQFTGEEEEGPHVPEVLGRDNLVFIGLDPDGNPIYFPKHLIPPEVLRYIREHGLPRPNGTVSKKARIKKKKKGEIGGGYTRGGYTRGGYTREDIDERLGEILGQNRTLTKEDIEELQAIGELLAAMRKGQVDRYGRIVPTGDRSAMPYYLGLFVLSTLLLEESLRRRKQKIK